MKIAIIIILIMLSCQLTEINDKLDKLIELNTPEYVNIVPDKAIID